MKRDQFTECRIISALKQLEGGIAVSDIARDLGISKATCYNWKLKYGGMEASEVKRLKDMEAEHAELKKMYAE
jgi:putative transposase